MKLYRRHYCETSHRTYAAMAKCIWKRAAWIEGDGEYATVSRCDSSGARLGASTTVHLHRSLEAATAALQRIDTFGCGGQCTRQHELVRLVLPGRPAKEE